MTKKELLEKIESIGLKLRYVPYEEPETGAICLKAKRQATINDGKLTGCEIDIIGAKTVRIWTCKTKLARKILSENNGCKVEFLDHECNLFVPIAIADKILPAFAKVRRKGRPMSADTIAKGISALKRHRMEQNGL